MKLNAGKIRLSASDLSNHLACHHLTTLDLSVAAGERPAPEWRSPDAALLQQRGLAHESAYLEHLRSEGLEIVALNEVDDENQAYLRTLSAMRAGAEVIAQGTLNIDSWFGRADALRRVEEASEFGPWSYEVYDCKLARETKGATILQLCLYSDLLARIQGILPEWAHVITPDVGFKDERYRVLDYSAYYRQVKAGLEKAVESDRSTLTAAEPTSHCEVCRWWTACDTQWRKEDHLSLVAGITKLQREQVKEWRVNTMEQLAALPLPLWDRPKHGSRETYVKVREQARVQVEGRRQKRPVHEVLPFLGEHGFGLLPEPSKGDVFFDLEGDPFVGVGGREYLFGFVSEDLEGSPVYKCLWALTEGEEKRAFEWLVDNLMARLSADPAMHIYHFAPYEPAALKRLMGRHATRENEIDRLLRSERFVDLHKVVRRAIRASVEQYSLKALESFHGYERVMPLENARHAMRKVQHRLELNEIAAIDKALQRELAEYNADDCLSARSLRQWMERERIALESTGVSIPRPTVADGAPSTKLDERQQRVAQLAEQLTEGLNPDRGQCTAKENARWVLSNLLDWHRREKKAEWWEYYRLRDLRDEELLEERSALAALEFLTRTTAPKKNPIDRYKFEKQETNIRPGNDVCEREEKIGEVIKIDIAARTVDIRRSKKTSHRHPKSIFVDSRGPTDDKQADALFRLGIWVRDHGLEQHGRYQAAIDLLLSRSPRLRAGRGALLQPGESTVDAAKRIGSLLSDSVLALQGPPGAGKTFTGARMICDLVRKRKKIGVTACSHRVIRKLLEEVIIAAGQENVTPMVCLHKVTDRSDEDLPAGIVETTDNAEALAAIERGDAQVVAGTSWLWAREEFFEKLDVLFVDEAGQISLADALAVSQAARSIVLLGDPQQLEQPCKGTHPEGIEVSALEHLLAGAKTMPSEKGLFLEETWRLHPRICSFTSEVFYENRLGSHVGLENQKIIGHPWLGEYGLWFIPVIHVGNQNACAEEVEKVTEIVRSLMRPEIKWVNWKAREHPIGNADVLVVAPYNAQVSDLAERLPEVRVGTVDNFQGQEAPIVVYSLTSSSPEEAPRGMEFLYSLNRLNVATSRAKAMVIIVGSPRLLGPECKSPRQMQLANALCRYVELAQVFGLPNATATSPGGLS